jgi:hypothetical protein
LERGKVANFGLAQIEIGQSYAGMRALDTRIRCVGLAFLFLVLAASVGCARVVTEVGPTDLPQGGGGEASSLGIPPLPIQADNIGGVKDDLLLVSIGNYVETCGPDAFYHYPTNAAPCMSGPSWQLKLQLPLASLHVGTVWSFSDISYGWGYEQINTIAPDDGCAGGGGSYEEGTAEVLSVSDSEIGLRLAGTLPIFPPETTDGDYVITLCEPIPPT